MFQNPESVYLISFSMVIAMKIVCFILGYKTIKLGYNLISSGAKGEFKFASKFLGFKADLVSVSPGLLFVLLGIMLIMVAITTEKNFTYYKETNSAPLSDSAMIRLKMIKPSDSAEIESTFK